MTQSHSPTGRIKFSDWQVTLRNALDQQTALITGHPPCQDFYPDTRITLNMLKPRGFGKSTFFRDVYKGLYPWPQWPVTWMQPDPMKIWFDECIPGEDRFSATPKPPNAFSAVHDAAVMALTALRDERGLNTYLSQLDVFRRNGVL